MFSSININNWRQFDKVSIDFDNRMTILTGANGSGKTTILNILGGLFGWTADIASTPRLSEEKGIFYDTDYHLDIEDFDLPKNEKFLVSSKTSCLIGEIKFDDDTVCRISVPKKAGTTYQVQFEGKKNQKGILISSHRNLFHYQDVKNIPTKAIKRGEALDLYSDYIRKKYYEAYMGDDSGATRQIKKTLISWAVYGYGNKAVKPDQTAKNLFEGFQMVLSKLLPPKLGFEKIEIDSPEVVLKTKTGDFSLDAVSGGIAALIEIGWQIYMCGKQEESFTVIFDEPENHLHPELQRRLMPSLLEAFPKVQFVVATHNPFVIGSIENSNVYVLNYNEKNKIESFCLDSANKAGTANEILRDILGIPVTFGSWVEIKLNSIIDKYSKTPITEGTIKRLKDELRVLGMDTFIPDSIVRVFENIKDDIQ